MWTYGKPVLSLCLIGVVGVLLVSAVFLICDWNVASMFLDFEVFVVFDWGACALIIMSIDLLPLILFAFARNR
jgi:hypothetical protein